MSNKIITLGDSHCGHIAGLTPPDWWFSPRRYPKARKTQELYWREFESHVKKHRKPDVLICNGDAIDGRGERSGSTELITTDRSDQCKMAIEALQMFEADKIFLTAGTPYHTGKLEDWEQLIADELGAEFHDHLFIEIDKVIFSVKHKPAGGSQVPHGRHTGIARDRLWNVLQADIEEQPKADIILRSHQHYHTGSFGPDWLAMILPALQGPGSKYGSRQCAGIVDWGIVIFETKKGGYTWRAETKRLKMAKKKLIRL